MSAGKDGSESVDQFLARIAGTPQGRDEATRRMDEEFLKGRQERQARRLERARSISPSKTGPAKTSSLSLDTPSTAERALNPPVDFSPQSKTLARSNAVTGRISPTKEIEAPSPRPLPSPTRSDSLSSAQQTASGLARSGTLSWQQRPASRDGPRQRPLSGFASVRSLPRQPVEDEKQEEPSRKDIAASLAQKDPTWFRQTQDRGLASAAYRKNQVEDTPEGSTSRSMQLPGMSRSREPSKSPVPEDRPTQKEKQSAIDQKDLDRFKRGTTPDIAALRNSMTEKPPPLRPTRQDSSATRPLSTDTSTTEDGTPDLTRSASMLSQNRPVSPTKGLGGFVESAMMRRSDSMSKRWSVKSNTGLKRGDSVAGARPTSLHNRGISRDIPPTRGETPSSPLASSRPGSSHNVEPVASPVLGNRSSQDPQDDLSHSSKREPVVSSSAVKVESATDRPQTPTDDAQLIRSPSKTMDPRRWSPTKSTWLESALQQKGEPPKMQPMKEEQPKWKVDLQRSKSQRASRDVSPDKRPQSQDLQSQDSSVKDTPAKTSPAIKSSPKSTTTTSTTAFPDWGTSSSIVGKSSPKESADPKQETTLKPEVKSAGVKTDQVKEQPMTDPERSEEVSKTSPVETSRKPPVLKPKPQTPPKTDFRATLKSRATGSEQSTKAEPEFKAVFGKLKRATTQNYVAPDEFKTNILSGKAALNLTGGPVKTKRVDEFKESILAKKEEMKAAPPKPQQREEPKEKLETPIPEALARRKTLSKASAPNLAHLKSQANDESPKPVTKPQVALKSPEIAKTEHDAKLSGQVLLNKPPGASLAAAEPAISKSLSSIKDEKAESTKLSTQQARPLPVISPKPAEANIPSPKSDVATNIRDLSPSSISLAAQTAVRSPEVSPPPKADSTAASKLASRLNPNLAAMLSRGPSPRPQGTPDASTDDLPAVSTAPSSQKDEGSNAASLTHMTKARTKGPKRRTPKVEPASTPASEAVKGSGPVKLTMSTPPGSDAAAIMSTQTHTDEDMPPVISPVPDKTAELVPKPLRLWGANTPKPASPVPAPLRELAQPKRQPAAMKNFNKLAKEEQAVQSNDEVSGAAKPKPIVASKSPELRKVSSPSSIDEKTKSAPRPLTPRKPSWSPAPKPSPATSAATPTKSTTLPVPSETATDVKTLTRSVTTGTQVKEQGAKLVSAAARPSTIQGLGLKMSPSPQASKPAPPPRVLTPPPDIEVAKDNFHQTPRIREVLEGYVGVISKEHDKADFDAQQFLTLAKQAEDKVKTLRYTINEITGDGKKIAIPPQQEHILYEESMYLITHKFSTEAGATTSEVYLWRGDRVVDASVEDAQIFCKRDAREHNAKLEVVKQGKEPSKLIQALGGILIVRRSKTSALYMLCGRRHLGHIVFDEVEMDVSSLCPGFAYLISAPFGKLYLWKGKGAGVDEVSSAKLIGMDLGLTGGIEEVDQGSEPSSFWAALGSKSKSTWSEDWHRRANMNGYPTVIYRIEHERPGMLTNLASWGLKRSASPAKQQIKATCERLQPFTQNDLDTPAVHIVDAYRTLYVLLTRQCASKASEFITALYLAQDFAMLSPAIQDRPVLPTCYVMAGEMTNDVKACFRKWSALEGNSLAGNESICVRLEEVMEALDL
ncbi:hypothetical protein PMZ80_001786 [Knufia obscura]|uniref:DUF4045 domain-containing protein n=1 Tax=Knufia obscura TaxID=1635080 RepID=A0ABR0S557_9EURO|nr:hypothetical protein PMZ80_001786 [Knufia obscura]